MGSRRGWGLAGLTRPLRLLSVTCRTARLPLSHSEHCTHPPTHPQFDEELHAWLADAAADDAPQRAQLLWLHELRMHEYGSAAATLGQLVQEAAPAAQPRLAALQRLAALAAGGEA